MRTPLIAALLALSLFPACGRSDGPSEAEKAAAKQAKDADLLALPYPKPTGVQPRSMETAYDGATDRTSTTLRLAGLRASGRGAGGVSAVTLYFTSSHKGRVRAPDNPEGSVDGSIVVQTSTPGLLAFSGPPGTASAGGTTTPLKAPSSGDAYTSARPGAAGEETVRFRFPTKALVPAVGADSITLSFGTIQVEISGQNLSDLREFTARLNPRP